MKTLFTFALLFSALLGSSSVNAATCPAATSGSCSTQMGCYEMSGSLPAQLLQAQCTAGGAGSSFSSGPCDTSNVVGNCMLSMGPQMSVVYHFYAPMPAQLINAICGGGMTCQ